MFAYQSASKAKFPADAKEISTYGETMGEAYDNISKKVESLNEVAKEKSKQLAKDKGVEWIDLTEEDYKSIPEYNESKRLQAVMDKMFSEGSMSEKTADVVEFWEKESGKRKRAKVQAEPNTTPIIVSHNIIFCIFSFSTFK